MNCPTCSAPILFGATSCTCGYSSAGAASDESALDVSYWEGLRAYWRVYWPTQLLAFVFLVVALRTLTAYVGYRRDLDPVSAPLPVPAWVCVLSLQLVAGAALLFLFVGRLLSRPYRGFSLVRVAAASGETSRHLGLEQRMRVWFFLWWRQLAAGLFATLLAAPLNVLLALMGLQISTQVATLAGLFIIGPILIKMLVGNPFPDFSIEARRGQARHTAPPNDPPAI
jgi:hypothetical protein